MNETGIISLTELHSAMVLYGITEGSAEGVQTLFDTLDVTSTYSLSLDRLRVWVATRE